MVRNEATPFCLLTPVYLSEGAPRFGFHVFVLSLRFGRSLEMMLFTRFLSQRNLDIVGEVL